MNIRPLGDKLIVRDDPLKNKTTRGILLPIKSQTSAQATVVAVGLGRILSQEGIRCRRNPMPAKVGDIVLVAKGGTPVEYKGQKCRIVDAQDIVAVRT